MRASDDGKSDPPGGQPQQDCARAAILRLLVGEPPVEGARIWIASHLPPIDANEGPPWSQYPTTSLADAANRLDALAARGEVYASYAWFRPEGGRLKERVVAKRSISADVDDKSMPGGSREERHRNARTLAGALSATHVLVDSGNGFHVHVLLAGSDRVEHFVETDDGVARVELLGRALRLFYEDKARELFGQPVALDRCHGAERVWRVPPGWNCKRADGTKGLTSVRGEWKPVLLAYPGRVEGLAGVVPGDLSCLIPFIEAAQQEAEQGSKGGVSATLDDVSLGGHSLVETSVAVATSARVHFHASMLPSRWQRDWPLDAPDHSRHDFDIAASLAERGWSPEVAAEAIRARRRALKDPEDRAKGGREDYVRSTVRQAYARAATPTRRAVPFVPLPLGVLPAPIRDYVDAGATALTCAPEAIVLPLLAGLGAAIGNARRVELKPGWSEPAVVWCAVILPSGKTKSPAQDLALRAIAAHQARAFDRYRAAKREYARRNAIHAKDRRAWERRRGDGDPPEEPPRPVCERIEVSNATLEAIVPILEENKKGVLVCCDELAGWAKSFDAYRQGRGSDREQWLSAHRAGRVVVDRKTNREMLFAPHGFIGVCGGIQPGILRQLLTPGMFASGLVARLLLAQPVPPRRRWSEASVPTRVRQRMLELFDALIGLKLESRAPTVLAWPPAPEAPPDEMEPVLIPLSAEARRAWATFYDEFAGEQESLDDDELGAAFSKLEAYAARFALIFTLVKWAAEPARPQPTEIDVESMGAGIELARWFAREAGRIYATLRESGGDADRRELAGWMELQDRPVTVRDVVRGRRRYRDDIELARHDLEDLVSRGTAWRLALAAPATGGHLTTAYRLRRRRSARGDGDTRSRESSTDKDLRERVSPDEGDSDPETPP